MSDQSQNIRIPTAQEVAAEVVASLSKMGMVVPRQSMNLEEAAAFLKCDPKHVRRLVELNRLKAVNISTGTGGKATLRFSPAVLAEYLKGE